MKLRIFCVLLLMLFSFSICAQQDTKTKGKSVLIDDMVMKIVDTSDGHKIRFRTHAGVYHLKKNSANYDTLLKALQQSLEKKKALKFNADSTFLEISELVVDKTK